MIRRGFTRGRWLAAALWLAFVPRLARAETTAAPVAASTPATGPTATLDRGMFGSLWVTPLATHQFQGAGMELGYHRRWLAGLYRIGFVQNSYAPVNDPSVELLFERTRRIFLDLEIDGQWQFRDGATVAIGAGAVLIDDLVSITSMNGLTRFTATDERNRVRPLVGVSLTGPLFETAVTFYVGPNPEARFSLGVSWGRAPRR